MRRGAGFTLVELLVVIVILGVLSGVVIFAVSRATSTASANACKTDVRSVESALEVWRAQNGSYPSPGPAGQAQLSTGAGAVLRSWPSSSQYAITLDATVAGQVNVTLPGGAPIAVGGAGQADPCAALGSGSTSTSSSTAASTSTTTTTSAPPSNGVTVTPSVSSGTGPWFGENQLALTNPAPMTALSITITVARTPGVSYNGQYTTFWGGTVNNGHTVTSATITYTFTIAPSTTIVAGSWLIAAQYNGTGTPRVTTGDTWSVTSTSGGVTSNLSGTF